MTTTPWHHWPVSILALLWSGLSAADYVLARLQFEPYVAYFTSDQLAYFSNLPFGVSLGWATGVWAGLAGAVLLWRQSHGAAVLLALSFAGLLAATVGLVFFTQPPMPAVTGQIGIWVMLGAIALAFLFFLYARAMAVRLRQG